MPSLVRTLLRFKRPFNFVRTVTTQEKFKSQDAKETHFGFETVKESEKAGKGVITYTRN